MGGMAQRTAWTGGWLIGLALAAAGCGAGAISASGSTTIPDDVTASSVRSTATTPAPTTSTVPPTTSTTVPPPVTTTTIPYVPGPLEPGDRGPDVTMLQEAMAEAGFFRDVVDGVFGHRTATAVIAVHKALDLPRNASWTEDDWEALASFPGPVLPDRANEPDRVEIDLTRQLLYLVEDGTVVDIIPVSSGNGELYENSTGELVRARTPRGNFSFYKHYDGWRISYLGGLYRPWYFYGGYAIHGSSSVPAFPASHGCVRVPNWEADHLFGELWIGLPVHVWD